MPEEKHRELLIGKRDKKDIPADYTLKGEDSTRTFTCPVHGDITDIVGRLETVANQIRRYFCPLCALDILKEHGLPFVEIRE